MTTFTEERVALITGASNGIGRELARKLLSEGWQVIALNRSDFNKEDTQFIQSERQGRLRVFKADLADFVSLRSALNAIKEQVDKIDLLFNNAGGSLPKLRLSKQGRELHFDLQTAAPYIIWMELKPLLLRGTMKTVINTSSHAFKTYTNFDSGQLEHPASFKKLFGPYAATKLALSLWTKELAPSVSKEGITMLSVDPGGNNTIRSVKQSGIPFYLKTVIKLFFPPPTAGASLLYSAAIHARNMQPGDFLVKGKAAKLKFTDQGSKVLQLVSSIYEAEFAAR
ncbi:SDR family NAD(P)-dependent oxidoreductase [Paenibacillus sp. YIM B09110]|uniref:SDR family NAD(P)-dependent oxidoreductase n=1 Tax=Paenibacillus sp. YIM B09110 TaxID=3126102 RepID=UPI00301C9C1B